MGSSGNLRATGVLPPDAEIDALLTRIRPPEERLGLARDLPVALRDHLRKTTKLVTREPHTRLAGSYSRHVSTHQIKDVDIVVFVDEMYRTRGPRSVLEDLDAAATTFEHRRKPGKIDRRAQRRSVRVAFTDEDFYIDLVPALAPAGPEGTLEIPDRDRGRWVQTASVGYGKVFSELNAKSGEQLVPLVLLLRHWQLVRCANVRVKGFWLEALAVHLVKTRAVGTGSRALLDIAADTFDAMYEYCRRATEAQRVPAIPDAVLGNNVAGLWTKEEFNVFFERLADAHNAVAQARAAKDEGAAISAWQKVFGSDYLAPPAPAVRALKWVIGITVGAIAVVILYAAGRKR